MTLDDILGRAYATAQMAHDRPGAVAQLKLDIAAWLNEPEATGDRNTELAQRRQRLNALKASIRPHDLKQRDHVGAVELELLEAALAS